VLRMTEATEVTTLLPSMSRFEIFSPLVASTWFQLNGLPAAVWLSVTCKTLLGRSRLEFVEQEPYPSHWPGIEAENDVRNSHSFPQSHILALEALILPSLCPISQPPSSFRVTGRFVCLSPCQACCRSSPPMTVSREQHSGCRDGRYCQQTLWWLRIRFRSRSIK
jgi:hypothetical protein